MKSLHQKVVWVAGGSTGIGLGIAQAFAAEGAHVVVSGRSASSLAQATADASLHARACDVTNRAQVDATVASIESEFGPIDILAYCAGTNIPNRTWREVTPEAFDQILATNTTGAFNCFHAVLPGMRQRKAGQIFNVVSVAGFRNLELAGMPYCASKFAQSSIGAYTNLEAMAEGIRVTNVYPGEVNTPLVDKREVPPSAEKRAAMLQPEDVAAVLITVARLPARAVVSELVITPSYQPIV